MESRDEIRRNETAAVCLERRKKMMWCSETETDVGFCSGQCKICDKSKSIKQGECQMLTQRAIDKQIERLQEEMVLAEKCMDELSKKKDEIQEVIELLKNEKMKQDNRLQAGETYGYVDDLGQICSKIESGLLPDEYRYEIGNYYLTKEDAIRAEKQIRLFRLLDRFSRQNGWTDELWKNSIIEKYYIYFDYNYKSIKTESVHISRYICQVYFVSESVAQQAIEKYHDLIMEVMAI